MPSPVDIRLASGGGAREGKEMIAGESARQARTAAESKRDTHSRGGVRLGRFSVGRFGRPTAWLGAVRSWKANPVADASAETTDSEWTSESELPTRLKDSSVDAILAPASW
jgi:hypothetical protein